MTLKDKKKYVLIFTLIILADQVSKFIIKSIFSREPYKVMKVMFIKLIISVPIIPT